MCSEPRAVAKHPIALREARHPRADGLDDARELIAEDRRPRVDDSGARSDEERFRGQRPAVGGQRVHQTQQAGVPQVHRFDVGRGRRVDPRSHIRAERFRQVLIHPAQRIHEHPEGWPQFGHAGQIDAVAAQHQDIVGKLCGQFLDEPGLPTPGSPHSTTAPPVPPSAVCRKSRTTASSPARPASGRSVARRPWIVHGCGEHTRSRIRAAGASVANTVVALAGMPRRLVDCGSPPGRHVTGACHTAWPRAPADRGQPPRLEGNSDTGSGVGSRTPGAGGHGDHATIGVRAAFMSVPARTRHGAPRLTVSNAAGVGSSVGRA